MRGWGTRLYETLETTIFLSIKGNIWLAAYPFRMSRLGMIQDITLYGRQVVDYCEMCVVWFAFPGGWTLGESFDHIWQRILFSVS